MVGQSELLSHNAAFPSSTLPRPKSYHVNKNFRIFPENVDSSLLRHQFTVTSSGVVLSPWFPNLAGKPLHLGLSDLA